MRDFLEEKWPELAVVAGFGVGWLAIIVSWL